MVSTRTLTDGLVAGVWAAVLSGIPSTVHSGLEPTLAAGSILLPRAKRPLLLAVAALPVHLSLSLGWGVALSLILPRRNTVLAGMVAGLGIAGLDLGVIGRRFPRIRELALLPQVADHLAYGAIVGIVIRHRRSKPT